MQTHIYVYSEVTSEGLAVRYRGFHYGRSRKIDECHADIRGETEYMPVGKVRHHRSKQPGYSVMLQR